MSEVGAVATKKKHSRRLLPGDSDYKPSKKPSISKRSPYPSRPLETKVVREEDLDDEVSGTIGSDIESEVEVVEERVVGEMARREESEIGTLLKYLLEKDDRRAEEHRVRRREEEERRKEEERVRAEEARKEKEEERERRRVENEQRRETERAREQEMRERWEREDARRQEESRGKDQKDRLHEKLKVMGAYKESAGLVDYLNKYERVMKEAGIEEAEWAEWLYPRLPEGLCTRVSSVRDEEADYRELKRVLLESVGETPLTYGHQLFETTADVLKHKASREISELIIRVSQGVLQGCKTLEQCVVALATVFTRRVMPQAGKVYMEGKEIDSLEDVRKLWDRWMSGRQKGNYLKPRLGDFGGERAVIKTERREGVGFTGITCFSCGTKGH